MHAAFETTRTMPIPMLNTWYISSVEIPPPRWISRNIGGTFHEDVSTRASQVVGRTRGKLSTKPPPVICAAPLIRPGGIEAMRG